MLAPLWFDALVGKKPIYHMQTVCVRGDQLFQFTDEAIQRSFLLGSFLGYRPQGEYPFKALFLESSLGYWPQGEVAIQESFTYRELLWALTSERRVHFKNLSFSSPFKSQ